MKDTAPSDKKPKLSAQDNTLQHVRATLLRMKRPDRVVSARTSTEKPSHVQKLDVKRPPDLPYKCGQEHCIVCFEQYFPAAFQVTNAEAAVMTTALRDSITQNFTILQAAVISHSTQITSRWRNKSKSKRAELLQEHTTLCHERWGSLHLLDAHSEEAQKKMTEFDLKHVEESEKTMTTYISQWLNKILLDGMAKEDFQDSWFLPYLDVETLSEDPARLLGMILNRARFHPAEWVGFDSSQMVLSEQMAVLDPTFNKKCIALDPTSYGSLVPWDKSKAHSWKIMGFTKARHLLTSQSKILQLLVNVIFQLLPSEVVTGLRTATPIPALDVHMAANLGRRQLTLSRSEYLDQPFRSPPTCDAEEILNKARLRWEAAIDDLELLQTDPAFLQLKVRQLAAGAYFEHIEAKDKWGWFTDEIILNALRREAYLRQLVWECENLVAAHRSLEDTSDPDAAARYDMMLHVIEDCCIEFLAVQIEKLQFGLPFKIGFERNYEFESQKVNKTGRKKPLVIYRDYFIHDPLYWSLGCIGWDEHRPFTLDPVFNIRVLEHCVSRGAKSDGQRLDQATYDQIDDIAVADEIRFAIRCNISRNRKYSVAELKGMLKAPARTDYIKKVQKVSFRDINIGLRGTLRDVMQPSWPTGPKNETWLAQADQCRANLSRFWTRFRGLYRTQQIKAGFAEDFIQAEIDIVSADLSERFVAEVRDARNAILNKSGSVSAQRSLPHELATISVPPPQIYDQKENVQIGPMRHAKVKTRGKTKDESMPVSVLPLEELEGPAIVTPIQVARDNLLVFKQMFPSHEEHFTRKLSWQHFCAAMVDAGFSMTQASGSAVSFRLFDTFHPGPASGASGSIVFHRPHPDSSIDPIMLRSFGKRLEKWFGWSRELFVERVKREGEAPA